MERNVNYTESTLKKLNVGFDDYDFDNKALIFVFGNSIQGFELLQKNEQFFTSMLNETMMGTSSIAYLYGSFYLTEKDTITVSVWYNGATLAIVFTILIFCIMLWFLMHFMLGVQSIGPAQFGKVKTD